MYKSISALPSTSDVEGNIIISMRKEKFIPNEYYHIYNRTIMSVPVFKNDQNAKRLKQSLLFANSTISSKIFQFLRDSEKPLETKLIEALKMLEKGEKIVDILCYAIMPDHYHMLIKEKKDGGIINFVRKCDISITKYINTKDKRRGPIFESLFKSKHVDSNEYLTHLSTYIHLNPLDIISGKEWRNHKLKNWSKIRKKIIDYTWSSLKFFLGDNFDPIISGEKTILEQFKNKKDYESFLCEWSNDSFINTKDIALE